MDNKFVFGNSDENQVFSCILSEFFQPPNSCMYNVWPEVIKYDEILFFYGSIKIIIQG